jgi:hypothetical protein
VVRASAAGLTPNLSQLMNTAPVHDVVSDFPSSAVDPVTAVEHMDDDDDDDDGPPGGVSVIRLSARPGAVSFRSGTCLPAKLGPSR